VISENGNFFAPKTHKIIGSQIWVLESV